MRYSLVVTILTLFYILEISISSLKADGEDLFIIDRAHFYMEKYKWGSEFYLGFSITASSAIEKANLTLSIQYAGKLVRSIPITLGVSDNKKNIGFSMDWGPLNEPYEYVLSGPYKIIVAFVSGNQNSSERMRLMPLFKEKESYSQEILIEWGENEIYKKEGESLKTYYLQIIKQLDRFSQDLKEQVALALNVQKAIKEGASNPYIDPSIGTFSKENWRKWYDGVFESRVQKEWEDFQKFSKKLFASRYPNTRGCIDEYFSMLLRVGRISSMEVHNTNKVDMDPRDTRRIDPLGVQKIDAQYAHLNTLLLHSCQDLGVDPDSILGRKLGK